MANDEKQALLKITFPLRPGNTGNIFLQLAMQQFVARITLPLRTTKIWNASDCYIEK